MQAVLDGGRGGGWRKKLTRRAAEVLWVLDHLWDLESDFSAIHGIRDMYSLPGPRFFAFAFRMPCYKGVMRARLEIEQESEQKGRGRTVTRNDDYKELSSDPATVRTSELGEFIELAEG